MQQVRARAFAQLGLRPWELLRYTPADFREALEAFEEERSKEREWVAHLVAIIVNTCRQGKGKALRGEDLLFKADHVRHAKRYRAAMEVQRKLAEEGKAPKIVATPDWGPI